MTGPGGHAAGCIVWVHREIPWDTVVKIHSTSGNRQSKRWPGSISLIHKICIDHEVCDCALQWRHNERDGVSNHQPHDCLFNRLFRCRSKKTSKLRITGLCVGNSPVTGEFSARMAINTENVTIWWRHHRIQRLRDICGNCYIHTSTIPIALLQSLLLYNFCNVWKFHLSARNI